MPAANAACRNLLTDYYDRLPAAIAATVDDPAPCKDPTAFSPGFALPDLSDDLREFLAVATAGWCELGEHRDHRLVLLDLAGNPGTNTTKTFASLLIVARAVEYLRRTGEKIMIFTPTSANKGTALRDAVLRALDAGLVTPDQLRVVTLSPAGCRAKLRGSRLATDPELRALNPVLCYTGAEPEDVKALGREFVARHAAALHADDGTNVWFSLELRNYLVADTARAFFERDVDPIEGGDRPRWHSHAVSSAYGLLGYHRGREVLEAAGEADGTRRPASLLVQHLGTPDMVLNLRHGGFDRAALPAYTLDPATGLHHRDGDDPHYPAVTGDPDEVLDPTFYSHRPPTSPAMNEIIHRYGGDGIVVSRHECAARYSELRALTAGLDRPLPDDPGTLREWSLVMALTGTLQAIERGLVTAGADVVVHGSGWYDAAEFDPLPDAAVLPVTDPDGVLAAVRPR
jgi:hypothetical protein